MNLKESIRAADDLPREPVDIPEWKDGAGKPIKVWVRPMMADERDSYEAELLRAQKEGAAGVSNVRGRYLARCTLDEQGARVFEDGDAEWIGQKSARAVERIFDVIIKLSGLAEGATETAKGN